MLDGVVMLNEPVDFTQRNKNYVFVFKVDFEKTFDFVSWDFLLYILRCINWIHTCMCSNFFSLMINGSPTLDFQESEGLF